MSEMAFADTWERTILTATYWSSLGACWSAAYAGDKSRAAILLAASILVFVVLCMRRPHHEIVDIEHVQLESGEWESRWITRAEAEQLKAEVGEPS